MRAVTFWARLFGGGLIIVTLVVLLVMLAGAGCAAVEERYTESDCDATPGVELSLGDGGWQVRPTLGC